MADRFLDFRSPTTKYNMPLLLPSSSALQSHNSRIRVRRVSKRQHNLTLLSATSSEFDVISTHEHSDGSLLFRFGVAENVESKTIKEEIEGEDESRVVKDLILEKKADIEEVVDLTNSTLSSSSIIAVVEGETEDVPTEHIEDAPQGKNEDYEDSSPVESSTLEESNNATTLEILEMENAENPLIREPIISVPDNGILEGTAVETDVSPISQHKIVETETNEDGTESSDSNFQCSSPQSEPAIILSNEIEEQNLQTEIQKVAIGEGGKSDTNDIEALEMQSLMSNSNASDASEAEAKSPIKEDEASGAGSRPVDEFPSEKDTIQLMTMPPPPEADSVIEEENGIGTMEESIEDDGSENQKVGDYIIEPSVLEATVTESTTISKSDVNDIKDLEMQNAMGNGTASDTSTMEENASGAGEERDTIQLLSMPPQLEVDSVPEVETSVESREDDGSKNLKVGDYIVEPSVLEATVTESTPISKSDVNDIKDLEMQNVMGNGNASDTSAIEENASGAEEERDTIQLLSMPPHLEVDSVPVVETSVVSLEESGEDDGSKNLKVGGDLIESSVSEAIETESTPPTISQEMLMTKFVLSSGAALLLHPSKVLTGGEDAYFVSGHAWLGVADGVGLWSLKGTSPGVYAQQLMKNCERLISVKNGDSINTPLELLNRSVAETDCPGSSTVLIAQFDGQALHVANVGDSGFIVLRNGTIHKRSSPMNHEFNFPIQIERGDDPSHLAQLYRVDVEEDDVIITATDGLLDNLYDQEISLIVMKSLASGKMLKEIAEKLALKAQEIGRCPYVRTPFGDDARASGFAGYTGGNLDDVAVIVSLVQRR